MVTLCTIYHRSPPSRGDVGKVSKLLKVRNREEEAVDIGRQARAGKEGESSDNSRSI